MTVSDVEIITGIIEDGSDYSDSVPDDLPPLIERGPFPRDSFGSNSENNDGSDESEEDEMDSDYEDIGADEDTEDEDEEEEDQDYYEFNQMMESEEMLRIIQRINVLNRWSDDEDEPVHDTNNINSNNHSYTCTCPACLVKRIPGSTDFTDNDETETWGTEVPLHPEASPCAVCMEPETWTRTFVDLPCCGPAKDTKSPYDTSSTRFCKKCFSRCIAMHRCAVPCEVSVVQMAGECPRCKKILVLEDSKTEAIYERDSLRPRPLHKRTKAQLPSTEALFWYVARNGNKDNAKYRPYLATLALCSNPSYIPEELLFEHSQTPEELRQLCQWGLLRKKETTKEWLQKNKMFTILTSILFNDLHLIPLRRLWEVLASIVGPRWESAKTTIYDWKLSQLYRAIREKLPIEAVREEAAVYSMDPLVHSQLRAFALLYIQESEKYEDERHLMPPILKDVTVTTEEMGLLLIVKLRNCRTSCAIGAWISLLAAKRALRKLHLWKGLWLVNHALSLVILATKELGVPPLCDWPERNTVQPSSWRRTLQNTRWQWHLLTGCNIVLAMQIWKILRELLKIGWDLVVGASFCLVVGKIITSFTAKPQCHEEWLKLTQYAACAIVVLHLGWNSWLHHAIQEALYRNPKHEVQG